MDNILHDYQKYLFQFLFNNDFYVEILIICHNYASISLNNIYKIDQIGIGKGRLSLIIL